MKLITFFGAGILALSSLFIIPNSASAATTPEIPAAPSDIDSSKPSLSELTAAISRVEQIENYFPYSQLSTAELQATTEFYREYIYLFNLVAKAHELQTNYATTSAEELNDIIAAAKDAEIACGYLFGTVRKNSANNTNTGNASNSSISTPNTPVATAPRPTSPITTAVAKTPASDASSVIATSQSPSATDHTASSNDDKATSSSSVDKQTLETFDTPSDIPEIPATGEARGSNKPLFITLSVVALACLFIGSMIILNRKKPYHPGRKF